MPGRRARRSGPSRVPGRVVGVVHPPLDRHHTARNERVIVPPLWDLSRTESPLQAEALDGRLLPDHLAVGARFVFFDHHDVPVGDVGLEPAPSATRNLPLPEREAINSAAKE